MAIRFIRKGQDEILRKKSREVTVFDNRLHQLLDDMADTMHAANGVGLAAVQVGVLRNVVIIDIDEGVVELINPVIIEHSEETINAAEGCLSFPHESGLVARPRSVTVRAQDRWGNPITVLGEELKARALCHEIDHLNGIVFLDIATEILDDDDDCEDDKD